MPVKEVEFEIMEKELNQLTDCGDTVKFPVSKTETE
jgi:hypothetical protein